MKTVLSITLATLLACGGSAKPTELPIQLLPATIETASQAGRTVLRVRVYAGADHRARVVGWEGELTKVLAKSSDLLAEAGVRLELTESIVWERSGGPLDKTLQALVAQDPGLDVDIVVGLVDASETLSSEFGDLAAVTVGARHIVVRGYHWQAESAALGAVADDISESARDRVLLSRRRHKQSLLLTHGIAALFGQPLALGKRYGLALKTLRPDAGAHLRQAIPEILTARTLAAASATKPEITVGSLRRIDTENLAQARLLLDAEKPSVAWEVLEPLLELYPDNSEIAEVGCLVADAVGKNAFSRCMHAMSLATSNASTHLVLGRLLIATDSEKATHHLERGESLLKDDSNEWSALARSYQQLHLATHALRAASKAADTKSITRWATEIKSRYAVHVAVPAKLEAKYLQALTAALKLVYAADFDRAKLAANDLAKNYPSSIGAHLVHCEVAMHQRNYSAALQHCDKVIQKHPKNSWARYLQGIAHARQRNVKQAIPLLQQAIAADPTLAPAYKALAKLYRKAGDARLDKLRSAYKNLFGKAL